ncbi:Zinc-finger homeodomain protein 8 [Linum grandiflorum]
MDLDTNNNINHLPTIIPKSSPSTSDTDTEAPPPPPPLQTHLQRSLSLSNGVIPRRHHPMLSASYKECLRNHAAGIGGLALDGCGEFMPSSPNSSSSAASGGEPSSLKCAACGCHRNFHRRESSGHYQQQQSLPFPALQWTHHRNSSLSPSPSPGQTSSGGGAPSPSMSPSSPAAASPTPQHSIFPSSAPHMLLALSSSAAAAAAEPNPNHYHNHHHHHQSTVGKNPAKTHNPSGEIGRKRARTRFTSDQKTRMHDFAERLGWKMLRGNEDKIVEDFCAGIGVRRNVFKVWMHNNKHRKDRFAGNGTNGANGNVNGGDGDDEDEDDKVKNVKYDLNSSSSNSTRVRFDTDVFESKVHVLHHGHGGSSP